MAELPKLRKSVDFVRNFQAWKKRTKPAQLHREIQNPRNASAWSEPLVVVQRFSSKAPASLIRDGASRPALMPRD
jgi:hypothetical protein